MRSFVAVVVLGVIGCASTVAVPVEPVTLVSVAQHAKVKVATRADILLVVDDSLSMSGKQQRLAAALSSFTADLDALRPAVDYQVAVVTTSVQERFGACGPAGDAKAAEQCDSDWGANGFVCDENLGCKRTSAAAGQLHAPPNAPAVLQRSKYDANTFNNLLSQAVQVGTDGLRQPQGMEAMKLTLSNKGNGFLRDDSRVVVAFITDAEDCSDPAGRFSALEYRPDGTIVDRCAEEAAGQGTGGYSLMPVSHYVQFLRDLRNSDGTQKEVAVAALVSLADGTQDPGLCTNDACTANCGAPAQVQQCQQRCANAADQNACVADCVGVCRSFCGGQVPGRRYLEMVSAFSGVAGSICADDASGPLSRLSAVLGIPKIIVLTAQPSDPQLLRVTVNRAGKTIECTPNVGYVLEQTTDGPAVRFTGDCLLQPNDTWNLRYLANK